MISFVIPTISQRESLTALVDSLDGEVIVCDNGHEPPIRGGHDLRGATLHEMWNYGWDQATGEYVCFLNDDIAPLADTFNDGMIRTMNTAERAALVSPNYDGRLMLGPEPVYDISVGGGMAGFAFMVRRDDPLRFPTWLKWFSGDSWILHKILERGDLAYISDGAECLHLDGGSQSADWTDHRDASDDQQKFQEWLRHHLPITVTPPKDG